MVQMYTAQPYGNHTGLSFRYNLPLHFLNLDLRHGGRFGLQIFQ
jgi:hypothetical protein